MDDLMGEFAAEIREGYGQLAPDLAQWRIDPHNGALSDAIFRFLHSAKGGAGFVHMARIEHLAAAAEQALSDLRHWDLATNCAHVALIIEVLDRINAIAEAIEMGIGFPTLGEDVLIEQLTGKVRAPAFPELPYDPQQIGSIRLPRGALDQAVRECARMNDDLIALGDTPLPAALALLRNDMQHHFQTVKQLRYAPVSQVFLGFDTYVETLAQLRGVTVAFVVEERGQWLDRAHLPIVRTAIGHLIRNAVAHGIEPLAQRIAQRKPACGTIRVTVTQDDADLFIAVHDDGSGVDYNRLIAQAETRAAVEDDLLTYIQQSGVTTADRVSSIAGHGVGLDSVRIALDRIDGALLLEDRPRSGFVATLKLLAAGV